MIEFFKKTKNYLPDNRKYWANYLFHFSDIKNIIKILESGTLYSRNNAIKRGLMHNDNASKEVIDQTMPHIHDFVRFYFRPMTPTQFNNEGLKEGCPKDKHCPIPIFLLFDKSIVNHHDSDCILCEKTLASPSSLELIKNSIDDLNSFPYEKIYHIGPYDINTDLDIKQYRQAEFCIKNQVGLEDLKYIVTRSLAEKEMLLYWLKSLNINTYNNIIKCSSELGFQLMFFKHNLYIDNVDLTDEYFKFQVMNYLSSYKIQIVIKYDNNPKRVYKYDANNSKFELDISKESYINSYKVKVVVDGNCMFISEHTKTNKKDIIF